MTGKIDPKILEEAVRRLVAGVKPEKIVMFGSQVWGDATEQSDVDLLVIIPESKISPAKRIMLALRCLRGLSFRKDILVKTRSEIDKYAKITSSLEYLILKNGKVLYG